LTKYFRPRYYFVMELPALLTVDEAAELLGRSPQAVRSMAASGDLDAVKRGNGWWLDALAVERRRRELPGRGRPLSPAMAWSVVLLASGEPELAGRVVAEAHQPSRARRWLREHPLPEHFPRLRARAGRESFDAHPAEINRILARADVMPSGISAADRVGLHGGAAAAEFYAPASARAAIVDEHSLDAGHGPVLARWVPDELWPVVGAPRAPRAAVLLDLLENDDPRARREAARALGSG
jgi:excisionase family DNA binding protein